MSGYSWVNARFSPTGTAVKVARGVAKGPGCPAKARSLPDAMLAAAEGMLRQAASEPRQPELFL